MDLLVVRHAIAEDRESFALGGGDDQERPLSAQGRRRFRRGAAGLATQVEGVDLLLTSPLVRARQTADLLHEALRRRGCKPGRAVCPALVPGAHPRELADWLAGAEAARLADPARATLAVVGHEPHLSHLVSWLASGSERSWIDLKKGSAVLLALDPSGRSVSAALRPGAATLTWALAPRQLRALADSS